MKKIFLTFLTVAFVTSIVFSNEKSNNSICADSIWMVSPNPFSTSTNIALYNLTSDTVSLKIYDRRGNTIKDFFNNLVISGSITVPFNADTTLPDGAYIVAFTKNKQVCGKQILKLTTTSISDFQPDEFKVETYPNPSNGIFMVQIEKYKIQNTNWKMEIYNMFGETIFYSTNQSLHPSIDISNQPNGVYFLNLKTENQSFTQKVIIQK